MAAPRTGKETWSVIAQTVADPEPIDPTDPVDPVEQNLDAKELPENFGVRLGVLAILNYLRVERKTGLSNDEIIQEMLVDRRLIQYNLKDPALDDTLRAGGQARNTVRVPMFDALFETLSVSKIYDPQQVETEHQAARLFFPEDTGGSGGGTPPYDTLWDMVVNMFDTKVRALQNARKRTQVPPPPPPMAAADKWTVVAQVQPEQQAAPGQQQQAGPLTQVYESMSDFENDLMTLGPEKAYDVVFQAVGEEATDAAADALKNFFQGSPTALGALYGMLIKAKRASPIDAQIVGELMEKHPELQEGQEQAPNPDAMAGLFMPKMVKTAESAAFPHYPPNEQCLRMCPKIRGLVHTDICRFHCLDGLTIADTQVVCGEAIWRQAVMDKYSLEYRDKDGKWVGGYLNKRFRIEQDDGGHPYLLKPGTRNMPIKEDAWGIEKRLQEMRRAEGEKREYSKTPGDPKGLYNFDQHELVPGPETPNLSLKPKDEISKLAGSTWSLTKLAKKDDSSWSLDKTAAGNPIGTLDLHSQVPLQDGGMMPNKVCPKCKQSNGKQVQNGTKCANPACTYVFSGGPGESQYAGEAQIPMKPVSASVEITLAHGIFKAASNGHSAYGTTQENALAKLANDMAPAPLEVGSIGQEETDLMQAEDSLQPPAVAQQPEAVPPQTPATIQPAAPPAQPEPVAEAAAPAEQLATPAGKVEVDRDDPFFGWTPKADDIAPEDLGWAKEPRQGEGHVGGDSLDAQITQEPPKEQAKTVEYMENMGA